MCRARSSWSGGSSGPSLRTRARTGFVSRPGSSPRSARTTPNAWRRPYSTRTASPGNSDERRSGRWYVSAWPPAGPAASTATSTQRPVTGLAMSEDDAPVGLQLVLQPDDLVDLLRGTFDLSRLVDDDVVVLVHPRHFELGVAVAPCLLLGRLGRPAGEPSLARVGRRRCDEDPQRIGDESVDLLGALDVDLEDRVTTTRKRLGDLVARRARPVAVDLARLKEVALDLLSEELVDAH